MIRVESMFKRCAAKKHLVRLRREQRKLLVYHAGAHDFDRAEHWYGPVWGAPSLDEWLRPGVRIPLKLRPYFEEDRRRNREALARVISYIRGGENP